MKNKLLVLWGIMSALAVSAYAQTATLAEQVEDNIDAVQTVGNKAYLIAAGLALAGVLIAFIRKAKR